MMLISNLRVELDIMLDIGINLFTDIQHPNLSIVHAHVDFRMQHGHAHEHGAFNIKHEHEHE